MAKLIPSLLLEVGIAQRDISTWEWWIYSGDNIHDAGFEETQLAARHAGNSARFLLFASGEHLLPPSSL
jgi:hypothetical protein